MPIRLQAALFGTSTRQYHLPNKGAFARALVARLRAAQPGGVPADETVTIDAPASDTLPNARREAQRREKSPELWQFGDLFASGESRSSCCTFQVIQKR